MESENQTDGGESLDEAQDSLETTSNQSNNSSTVNNPTPGSEPKENLKPKKNFFKEMNIYLLLFILIVLLSGVIVTISYLQSKNNAKQTNLQSQSLTQSTLNQLANNDVSVGAPKQILNVEANAVFAGKVLISDGLQVSGNTQLNGGLTLSGITVNGIGTFQQLTSSNGLTVTGNTSLQGPTTVAQSLQVNGTGTFNGSLSTTALTTGALNLSGDLTLAHHLVTSGVSPTSSMGSALGSGGTATLNGSDTAGNININTGSSPSAGCFITIYFNKSYANAPYVIVTPSSSPAASISYYINRSSNSFSLCDSNVPPANQSTINFDYFVAD